MPTESIEVSARFPVTPDRLYSAWLDSQEHTRFTGDTARVDPMVGGRFSAWSGYITGETLELDPPRRIVQSWRNSEFPDGASDSRIELSFEPEGEGTRLTIVHTGIPEGQADQCEDGWIDYYFEPMQRYFRRLADKLAAPDEPAGAGMAAMKVVAAASAKKAAAAGPVRRGRTAAKKNAAKPARNAAKKAGRKAARKVAGRKLARKVAGRKPARKVAGRKAARTGSGVRGRKTARTVTRRKRATGRGATRKRATGRGTARKRATGRRATRRGATRRATTRKGARRR